MQVQLLGNLCMFFVSFVKRANMERKKSCPLGSKCEEIKGDVLYTCHWYIELKGKNPQTDEVINEKGCAMAWLPILMIENSSHNILTTQAVYNLRDETIKRQEEAMSLINGVSDAKLINH